MVIAAVLAVFALAGGITYYALRPITLRIAVGPPSSDDVKVIQALSQAFARDHAHIRLRPVITEGASQSAADLAQGKTDLVNVVTAVSETEVAIDAVVAVRDKVIQAYEDIMKMPI